MKNLNLDEMEKVSGGTRCTCMNYPFDTAQPAGVVWNKWVKDKATRSECQDDCCEVSGGASFKYGSSYKNC